MALDKKKLDPTGSGSKGAGAIGFYSSSTDNKATIDANGYFDDAYNELAHTKALVIEASDATFIRKVTRTAPTDVAIAALDA